MTSLQFRTEQAATQMLRNAKQKVEWSILALDTCPNDIASMADDMQQADLAYRQARDRLSAALTDKVILPDAKRLIVTTGRNPDPNSVSPLLYAIVDGSTAKSTRVVSFDQFVKSK